MGKGDRKTGSGGRADSQGSIIEEKRKVFHLTRAKEKDSNRLSLLDDKKRAWNCRREEGGKVIVGGQGRGEILCSDKEGRYRPTSWKEKERKREGSKNAFFLWRQGREKRKLLVFETSGNRGSISSQRKEEYDAQAKKKEVCPVLGGPLLQRQLKRYEPFLYICGGGQKGGEGWPLTRRQKKKKE